MCLRVQENREPHTGFMRPMTRTSIALQKRKIGIEIGGAKCQRGAGEAPC